MDERTLPHLRVAIIHYWLTGMRGREKVVEALCRIFPQADIYTHVVRPEALSETITSHPIIRHLSKSFREACGITRNTFP